MDATWQQLVVLLIVAGAAWVLARRAVRLLKTSAGGGCGSGTCKSCSTSDSSTVPSELVQIARGDQEVASGPHAGA
jgi:hypothetical protein